MPTPAVTSPSALASAPSVCHALLIKCAGAVSRQQLHAWQHPALPVAVQLQGACTRVTANGAGATNQGQHSEPPTLHIYARFAQPLRMHSELLAGWAHSWQAHTGLVGQVSRLRLMLDCPSASQAELATTHYTVETDPAEGWADEIYRWYDTEHMPGLAQVHGTVRAQRFINLDHSPQSLAAYDLTAATVMGSPDWLAVRGTAWSSRCRPHFTNTLRTMFGHTL